MKKISFILQQKAVLFLVDWNKLLHESDPMMDLVLLSDKGCIDTLSAEDKKRFTDIIELDQFEFSAAKQEMDKIFARHYQIGDETHIATLHEFQLELVAKLRDHYRIAFNTQGPGIEVIQNFRNKLLMKKLLGPKGIGIPKYMEFDSEGYKNNSDGYLQFMEKFLGFPMFVKPVDSAGSINTAFIKDTQALKIWCDNASVSNQVYEVDEFIDGTLFHCDSVIQNGRVQFTLVSKYLHPNADAFSGKALATMTLNPTSEEYNRLKQFAETALSHFPTLPDGITHLEVFKKNSNNELVFLEVAARAPGAVAPEMYKVRTGVDIRQVHLRLNLGLNVDVSLKQLNATNKWGPFASMYQLVAPYHGGIISKLKLPVFHGGDFNTEWRCREGELIEPASSILNVIASTIFWNENYEALEQDFNLLDQQHIVEILPTPILCLQEKSKAKLSKNLSHKTNDLIASNHFNRSGDPGCIYRPSFFNRRNLASGAVSMVSQITGQTANDEAVYSPTKTEVDPRLLFGLILGSGAMVIFLLYALWRISSTKEPNVEDANLDDNPELNLYF